MLNLFARISQWRHAPRGNAFAAASRGSSLANSLMERAEACAGTNPHQAAELRLAAQKFLSVVR